MITTAIFTMLDGKIIQISPLTEGCIGLASHDVSIDGQHAEQREARIDPQTEPPHVAQRLLKHARLQLLLLRMRKKATNELGFKEATCPNKTSQITCA